MKQTGKDFLRPQVRRLFRAAFWLVLGRVVIVVNSFVISIWIARHLGPADYGVFSYVTTLANLAGPLVGFGLSNLVLRDLKLQPGETPQILGSSILLRIVGTLAAAGIVFGVTSASSIDYPGFAILATGLILSFIPSAPRGVEYYFNATDRQSYFVIANTLNILVFAAVKIYILTTGGGVTELIVVLMFETAAIGALCVVAYRIAGRDVREWRVSRGWLRTYLRRGGVLMIAGFGEVVATRLDVILVAEIIGPAEAGVYAAASRISQIANSVPVALAAAVFPRLLEMDGEDPVRSEKALQDVLDVLSAAALGLAVGVTLFAQPVIDALLGSQYAASAQILVVHIWVCVFTFTRAVVDNWLISRELDRLSAMVHGGGVLLNLVLNLILIPHFGGLGAAAAMVMSYALASVVVLGASRSGRPMLRMVFKAILTWPVRVPRLMRRLL